MNGPGEANFTAIIIVGFRNPAAIAACLRALSHATRNPHFHVFIAENGGAEATNRLVATLTEAEGPCAPDHVVAAHHLCPSGARQTTELHLRASAGDIRCCVFVSEMIENNGYADGVNRWVAALAPLQDWTGVWVLNPIPSQKRTRCSS